MNFTEFKNRFQKIEVKEISYSPPKDPVVTVLVQTYQQKEYIKYCLDGILHQKTTFPFEVIIGDDNSTDGTREICLEYAKKFPQRIRLFLHKKESQIFILGEGTSNFNAFYNFFSAKGKYIAFCEGDDFWDDPYKLQKQIDFLEDNPLYVLTYHPYKEVDESGKISQETSFVVQPANDINKEELKKGEYHPLLLTICFRNCIRFIPDEILEVINVDSFLLSLLGQYGKAKFLNDIKPAAYRKHRGGVWSKRQKKLKFISKIRTYRKLLEYYEKIEDTEIIDYYTKKLKYTYKTLILINLKAGNFIEAFSTAKRMRQTL